MRPEQDGWKLVRHLMPAAWTNPIIREVKGAEHIRFLRWKLDEEVGEIMGAEKKCDLALEVADARQVLIDFCNVTGITIQDLGIAPYEELVERVPRGAKAAVIADLGNELRALADAFLEADEDGSPAIVAATAETLGIVTAAAGIREDVRMGLAWKLRESGGFNPGVAWKVVQKPLP